MITGFSKLKEATLNALFMMNTAPNEAALNFFLPTKVPKEDSREFGLKEESVGILPLCARLFRKQRVS